MTGADVSVEPATRRLLGFLHLTLTAVDSLHRRAVAADRNDVASILSSAQIALHDARRLLRP